METLECRQRSFRPYAIIRSCYRKHTCVQNLYICDLSNNRLGDDLGEGMACSLNVNVGGQGYPRRLDHLASGTGEPRGEYLGVTPSREVGIAVDMLDESIGRSMLFEVPSMFGFPLLETSTSFPYVHTIAATTGNLVDLAQRQGVGRATNCHHVANLRSTRRGDLDSWSNEGLDRIDQR